MADTSDRGGAEKRGGEELGGMKCNKYSLPQIANGTFNHGFKCANH